MFKIPENIATIYYKISLCGYIAKTRLQLNLHWNSYIFIQENECENVVCEMVVISSRPQMC